MWLMVVGANGYRIRCELMESLTLNGIHRLLPYSTVLVWDVTLDREGTDGWWAGLRHWTGPCKNHSSGDPVRSTLPGRCAVIRAWGHGTARVAFSAGPVN